LNSRFCRSRSDLDIASQFDVTLAVADVGGGELSGSFQFNTDLFDRQTIDNMAQHYRNILEGVAANPATLVSQLSLLSQQDLQQVLVGLNHTDMEVPAYRSLREMFERQAEETPERLALQGHGVFAASSPLAHCSLSYRELDLLANQVSCVHII
jgi:non-ribosomal peptide synthetase component F